MKKNRMIWLKMSSFIVYDTVSEWCAPVFQHVHYTHANTHTNNTNNTQDIERKHWIDWNYVFFVVSRNAGEKRNRTTPSESEQKLPKTVSYTHICTYDSQLCGYCLYHVQTVHCLVRIEVFSR